MLEKPANAAAGITTDTDGTLGETPCDEEKKRLIFALDLLTREDYADFVQSKKRRTTRQNNAAQNAGRNSADKENPPQPTSSQQPTASPPSHNPQPTRTLPQRQARPQSSTSTNPPPQNPKSIGRQQSASRRKRGQEESLEIEDSPCVTLISSQFLTSAHRPIVALPRVEINRTRLKRRY